jgi:S-adenosyl-L-methionine methyltransferase
VSRLDSFIRRLKAQRACLDQAAVLIRDVEGPVLEFGLGNGRTYDHLREIMPDRAIYAFDRRIAAHPACIPDKEHMILGDLHDTVPGALQRIGRQAALMHFDVGSGDEAANAKLARWLVTATADLLAPGGIAVGDQPMVGTSWTPIALPDGVPVGRYFMYRRDKP